MTGNRRAITVLQERDRKLLEELSSMRVVDREQAKLVAGFNSTTRANARLLKLTRAGRLRRIFIGGNQAVYTLASTQADTAGSTARTGEPLLLFCRHQLEVNAVYLALTHRPLPEGVHCLRFLRFRQALSPAVALIPDAYLELERSGAIRPMFLEVDLGTESLPVWQRKTREYVQLAVSGEFPKLFSQARFGVLVVTTTQKRMEHLRAEVACATQKIFWFTTFENINSCGLWSAIWWRPAGDRPQALL